MAPRAPISSATSSTQQPRKVNNLDVEVLDGETITIGTKIGQGRFKSVYAGYHQDHGPVAVLRYDADNNQNETNEAEILGYLSRMDSSSHVPEFFGVFQEPSGCLLLAQEVSMLGSVRSVLKEPDLASSVTLAHKINVAAQLAGAVAYLESVRIIHTDIACRNILVFELEDEPEAVTVKLTDFTFATCLPPETDKIVKRQPQAIRWCAPETIASMEWSFNTDVWSLGATLWELFSCGEAPWVRYKKRADVTKKLHELAQLSSETEARISEEFPSLGTQVIDTIVLSCLRVDPSLRPPSEMIALAFEHLVDIVDTGDELWADIDVSLDDSGRTTTSKAVAEQPAPAHERSRPRKTSERNCEDSPSKDENHTPRRSRPEHRSAPSCTPQKTSKSESEPKYGPPKCGEKPARNPPTPPDSVDEPRTMWRQVSARESAASIMPTSSLGSSVSAPALAPIIPTSSPILTWCTGTPPVHTRTPSIATSTPSTADTPMRVGVGPAAHERVQKTVPVQAPLSQNNSQWMSTRTLRSGAVTPSPTETRSTSPGAQAVAERLLAFRGRAPAREAISPWPKVQEPRMSGCHVVPLKPLGGASWGVDTQQAMEGLEAGKWTLWTYINPALQREDFANEHEARIALESRRSRTGVGPCVLRAPTGQEIGATAWKTTTTFS